MKPQVRIIHRAGTGNMIGRRLGDGTIQITLPAGVDERRAADAIERMVKRIEERTPVVTDAEKAMFRDGMVVETDYIRFRISKKGAPANRIRAIRAPDGWTIAVGEGFEFGHPQTDAGISNVMLRVASALAPSCLLAEAEDIARGIGVAPRCWKVGRGVRTLGSCRSDGSIILSAAVMFLPHDLREYIVCHELAHLTEMNHSAEFHRLCDRYCGGRERELSVRLKNFRWPIIRV